MDPQNILSFNENVSSSPCNRETCLGHNLENRLQLIPRTPSPLPVIDNHVGNAGSSGTFYRETRCPPNSRQISIASSELFVSPEDSDNLNSPLSNVQELDPNLFTQTDNVQHDSASLIDRDLVTSESQSRLDEDLDDIVIEDDFGSVAASRSRGRSSDKQKIGKTVSASPTNISPIKKTLSGKKKGPRNMLKELLPHNEDVSRKDTSTLLNDTSGVKLTRAETEALRIAKQDKVPSPRKTLNIGKLMAEQCQHDRDQKKYYPTNEQTPRKSTRLSGSKAEAAKNSLLVDAQMTTVQPRKTPDQKAVDAVMEIQATMALDEWDKWHSRKARTTKLLSKRQHTAFAEAHNPQALKLAKTPAYLPGSGIPDGFNLLMDNGLHVFSPTANVFNDFPAFLEAVEEIAGRKQGVIKVIVPKDCFKPRNKPSYTSVNQSGLKELKTCMTRLELRKDRATNTAVYDVLTPHTEGIAAAAWRQSIQEERRKLQKQLGAIGLGVEDLWKESHRPDIYNEKAMIKDNHQWADDIYYAPDIAATDDLRDTLRCGNPELKAYQGNALFKSQSVKAGVNSPVFNVSSSDGTAFGMRVADLGGYLLNYLHDGAPQVWSIATPIEHKKLEETLHSFQQLPRTGKKGTGLAISRPPPCDNFLKHKQMYIPEETLRSYDINYTKVVQYLGEMVIVFPFAYHQAYNTGANIVESMAYASDRWEMFPAKQLLKHCNEECSPGAVPPEFDLGFISISPPDEAEGNPGSCGSSTSSPISSPPSSSATSEPEKQHSDKRLRSGIRKPCWESIDGTWDESGRDHNPASPTEDSTQISKRAKTKTTDQDTDSDNAAEIESLKQQIQHLVEENSKLKKPA